MIHRIDPPHRLLARLLFGHVGDQARRAGDHEDAVEHARVEPESARIAPIAPSTLIGSGLPIAANARSTARAAPMCVVGPPVNPASAANSNSRAVRGSFVWMRWPKPRNAFALRL